jgi:hypothetical protein
MPLPDANNYSMRIYELLKETDLENLSYSQFQNVAEKLFIEPENEDEMRRLVLVQLARMAVRGDWDGFLSGGGGGGAPTDAEYVVMSLNGTLTNERVLTAGTGINITDGGAGGNVTIASTVTGTIEGSIANTQVAVGSAADTIAGSGSLTYNSATLNVSNQIELGDVGAAGILKNSNNNQDMRIQVAGTGNVRIENQTTNTASQLNVKGNGTGTPIVSLSNDTKSVSVQCDDNQKLTVKGGTEEFVLDVSSATGGLTFPDGTTQTTAASGGSSEWNVVNTQDNINSGFTRHVVSKNFPWGRIGTSTSTAGNIDDPTCRPFISPISGDVTEIGVVVTTADAAGVSSLLIGIYSDSSGAPNSLLGSAVMNCTSTGSSYQTSFTGTATLVKGKQYWIMSVRNNSTNSIAVVAESNSNLAWVGGSAGVTQFPNNQATLLLSSSSNTLPATVTQTNLSPSFRAPVTCGLKIA